MRLIETILMQDVKNSELKMLKYIFDNPNVKISKLKEVSSWYQIRENIKHLTEMDMIKVNDGISINMTNKINIMLFSEV